MKHGFMGGTKHSGRCFFTNNKYLKKEPRHVFMSVVLTKITYINLDLTQHQQYQQIAEADIDMNTKLRLAVAFSTGLVVPVCPLVNKEDTAPTVCASV